MNILRTFGPRLGAFVLLFALASNAHADDLDRSRRLRIAGWTAVGVGTVLAGTGTGLIVSVDCVDPACSDDEVFRQNMGIVTISLGVATAVGVGMPMLIRARALSRDKDGATNGEAMSQEGSHLSLSVGPASLMLYGAF